ncbi:twin-arginine translocase TatA/TatE family subunit [Kribbella sp. CA-293567]|uniref:twin-arginine translocase TatA/TatE family subunit n=1 Tax=Kribbella sp. CA-293567 TaxID=3002436 RepID=UPI0022DDAE2C|nr:twin-arginine translocase TatA/TatE family subunit [Kribbella sp. CA-293567]WBQ03866.1 twin-arginine translocase TatA/TatE family subunit [Kribbella sp. CA-293567]
MLTLLGMPQGPEWLIILAIVVLLFGSAKLPGLVKQLGRSKKIWEEEVGPRTKADAELDAAPKPAEQHGSPTPRVTSPLD